MSADAATLAYYEREASAYTLSFGQAPNRDLDAFLDRLEPAARILELGCGAGSDAERMIGRGFAVDATDGAAAMVRQANERFAVGARVMRFEELDACEAYDAVWAHASLLHVATADLPEIFARIRRALRPGGWHFASFKLGAGDARDALGRLNNFPGADGLIAQYREAGFAIREALEYPGKGADGVARDWLALTVQRC